MPFVFREPGGAWTARFLDHLGARRKIGGFASRELASFVGERFERLVERRVAGAPLSAELRRWLERDASDRIRDRALELDLVRQDEMLALRPIGELVDAYVASIESRRRSEQHVRDTRRRVETCLDGAGVRRWADLSGRALQEYLARRVKPRDKKQRPLSLTSANGYLTAIKSFCRWVEREYGQPPSSVMAVPSFPVMHTDLAHPRRQFTVDELRSLLACLPGAADFEGVTWRERRLAYLAAFYTGRRADALRSVRVEHFLLDAEPPLLRLPAHLDKARRERLVPLHPVLVRELERAFVFRAPTAAALRMVRRSRLAESLRRDLERAGVPYRTAEGFADFHSLRGSFATEAAAGGVEAVDLADLVGHSDFRTTRKHYLGRIRAGVLAAVQVLPDITQPAAPGGRQAAGGAG